MHQADILDEVRERVTRNRGGVAVFNSLSPRQTAHIVVDLQNGFMAHGQIAETPMARTIVPNVNRISAALRAAGGSVIYTQHTADAEAIRNTFDVIHRELGVLCLQRLPRAVPSCALR
jgi:ureidoacrylate peracid hydrolase